MANLSAERPLANSNTSRSSRANQTLPGRGSGRSTEGIYCDCKQDFQKGKGDPILASEVESGTALYGYA